MCALLGNKFWSAGLTQGNASYHKKNDIKIWLSQVFIQKVWCMFELAFFLCAVIKQIQHLISLSSVTFYYLIRNFKVLSTSVKCWALWSSSDCPLKVCSTFQDCDLWLTRTIVLKRKRNLVSLITSSIKTKQPSKV